MLLLIIVKKKPNGCLGAVIGSNAEGLGRKDLPKM